MNIENGSSCPTPGNCPDHYGTMPPCANLAVSYVPFQQEKSIRYNQTEALSNGTLYPGLNLPFYLKVEGGTLPDSPVSELQALDFVLMELGHYLDTHQDDDEAIALYQQYSSMAKGARTAYEKKYGPLLRGNSVRDNKYCWLKGPWPWDYEQNEAR